jgi:hypothetical protein
MEMRNLALLGRELDGQLDRIVLHEHREEAVVRDLEDRESPGRVLVRLRKRECELANRFGDAPLGNRH